MNYTILFYSSPDDFSARTDPKRRDALWGNFMPYLKAVQDAGIFVTGAGLEPPETAASVKIRNGQPLVQDGPFADAKEQLAGFFVINVPDLETAISWAARYPASEGSGAEVRPNLPPQAGR